MIETTEHEPLAPDAASTPRAALDDAYSRRYADLCRIARARLRCIGHSDLDSNSLVHESYLRLAAVSPTLTDARHFFAYAAKTMRNLAIDDVRRPGLRVESKPGDEVDVEAMGHSRGAAADAQSEQRLHDALLALESADPVLAACVRMRYFEGYSEQEIAWLTGSSRRTIRRQWERARALLQALLSN